MSLKYLVTILYRPRATMRRILASPQRWSVEVVILAAVCALYSDADLRRAGEMLPQLQFKTVPLAAILVLSIIANAISWLLIWLLISLIAFGVGRLLEGRATMSDVRAALAWALVPTIWSPIWRVPAMILARGLHAGPTIDMHRELVDFLARGGCSLLVVFVFLQLFFELACVVLACFTVAEAEKFSTQKGFVAIASTLVLPVMVILAAVFSFRS